MDQALLTVAAGMKARLETLDVLGNNIANASTNGFKADREFYRLFTTERTRFGGGDDALRLMPVVEASIVDFTQGPLMATESPLDVALSGPGFLVVRSPRGVLYTRNGSLQRLVSGALATVDGYPVLGTDQKEIVLPENGQVRIESDGRVIVDGLEAGQLQVIEFGAPRALSKAGNNYFSADEGGAPKPAEGTGVLQGRLEASNINASEEAVNLITAGRHFAMMRRIASLIGDEMNGRAVQELGRTS